MILARVAVALLLACGTARAATLVGVSFEDGQVYDIDADTGAAANPRTVLLPTPCWEQGCPQGFVNLSRYAGVEVVDGGLLVGTVETAPFYPSTIVRASLATGAMFADAGLAAGVQIGEGDLAADPATGDLYAVGLTDSIAPFTLVRIQGSASATVMGQIGFSDVSGLAFDAAGTLYGLDTGSDALLVLDPADASTLSTTPLSEPLGALAGMDFDPDTDTLYVADGGTGGQSALFTLDPTSGLLTEIGPLGIASGLSGLAVVPEPHAVALGGAALAALLLVERRCA